MFTSTDPKMAAKSKHEALAAKKAILDKRLQDVQTSLNSGTKTSKTASSTPVLAAAAASTPAGQYCYYS